MEVISIRTFCQRVPFFDRKKTLKLIEWGVLKTVIYGDKTLIRVDSLDAVLVRMGSAYQGFSLEDLQATIYGRAL